MDSGHANGQMVRAQRSLESSVVRRGSQLVVGVSEQGILEND